MKRSERTGARRARRSGSVVVMVAGSLVMLLGFSALSVDYGVLVATRNQLQRGCDAGALAGAAELPADQAAATKQATDAAKSNGLAPGEITVTFPTANRIQVRSRRTVPALFAQVLGVQSKDVSAAALAGRDGLVKVSGVAPIAITEDDYNTYKGGASFGPRMADNNRQDFVAGTFVGMDLRVGNNGKSPSQFEEDVREGYNGQAHLGIAINNTINADLDNQGRRVVSAIANRILQAAQPPWQDLGNEARYQFPNYPADNPRVMMIMVADSNPRDNSNPKTTAKFFVPVYIQSVTVKTEEVTTNGNGNGNGNGGHGGGGNGGGGGTTTVTRYILNMRILPKRDYSSEDPNVQVGDESTPNTGIGVIRLLS